MSEEGSAVRLSAFDRALLAGEEGEAPQLAMRILARMAEVRDAGSMLDIEAAHIDSTIYVGDAGLEFAERLAGLGARVRVPSTLNVSGLDEFNWRDWSVPPEWAEKSARQMRAYASMGTIPTWTCAPYQGRQTPRFGQQIAWGESNAVCFANSVIGARTERYPDLLDICCAITGRAPAVGLHLDENRLATRVLRLRDIPEELAAADDFYPVLGHLLGPFAEDDPVAIAGLPVIPEEDQLKALGAAAASSGAVALFHIPGVTPEAPTLRDALGGRKPVATRDVGLEELRAARRELTTHGEGALDMVVLGSPHFSFAEFGKLAALLRDRGARRASREEARERRMRTGGDHEPRGPRPGRTRGAARTASGLRGPPHGGYLCPGHPHGPRDHAPPHDELRQVRVVLP